jgi:hypothetical protein
MQFANFYALDMGTISNGLAKTDGMAVGLAAAGGLIALRQNDGFRAIVPYTFLPLGPGVYQKTPGPDGTIGTYIGPATPWMKQFRPFAMLAPDQFRADPPPALDSAQWAEDFNEVKAFGAASNLPNSRSAEQEEIGLFYGLINAQVQVNRNLRKLAADQGLSAGPTADIGESSRFFAQATVTMSDAFVGCWDSKYLYNFWRPVTAIQKADLDNNADTTKDGSWLPLLVTPPFPSYISGHSTFSGAAATVLTSVFGAIPFTDTGDQGTFTQRSFTNFQQAADEAGMSRIYGGIHYSFDNADGLSTGRALGQFVVNNFLS